MKILYLTELLSPYRIEWMNLLSSDNTVTAYYITDEEKTRTNEWLNCHQPHFATKKVARNRLVSKLPSGEYLKAIKADDSDIYIIDGYSSPIKLRTIKLLLRQHKNVFINIDGIDVWREKRAADIVKDTIKRRVFRSGASFLCGSQIAAETVIAGGADKDKVFVHPFTSLHTDDLLTFEQKQLLQQEKKNQLHKADKKIALAVGRFIPLKHYDRLIRAWQGMPDNCYLYIIGGGEERGHYEELIRTLNVRNIELIDFLLPEELTAYFQAADLFVHPSSTETWGLVINEAMANGCPVIATDHCVGGVELIRDGMEGYLIKVGDIEDLHRKLQQILGDDALRNKMAENAIDRIAPYTYENLAATHMKIFQKK